MRRASLVIGWAVLVSLVLFGLLSVAQAAPVVLGNLLRLDRVDAGNNPAPSSINEGSLSYDPISKRVQTNNSTTWYRVVTDTFDGGVTIYDNGLALRGSVYSPVTVVAPNGLQGDTNLSASNLYGTGVYGFTTTSAATVADFVAGVAGENYHGSSGLVNTAAGVVTYVEANGAGNLNNAVSIEAFNNTQAGAGTITNNLGLYLVGPWTGATVKNYPILFEDTVTQDNSAHLDGTGRWASATPLLIDSVFANATVVAGTTIGGGVWPAMPITLKAARFRITTAGTVGSTNATLRASDGVNNCDFSFACNLAAGNKRIAATGSCVFAASASITYTVNSTGDCVLGPTILGNINMEGWLQ